MHKPNTDKIFRVGWNLTNISKGCTVLIHSSGFGKSTYAKITELFAPESSAYCEVEISNCGVTKIGCAPGNKFNIVPARLERVEK